LDWLKIFYFVWNDFDGDRDVSRVLIVDRLSKEKLRFLKDVDLGLAVEFIKNEKGWKKYFFNKINKNKIKSNIWWNNDEK
jgi:hypothetical protein